MSRAGPEVAEHFGRYPVVFLTLKDVKHTSFSLCRAHVAQEVGREVRRLEPVWGRAPLDPIERRTLRALAEEEATDAQLPSALALLTRALHLGSGEPAVLLIDEYDTPIHAGWSNGYQVRERDYAAALRRRPPRRRRRSHLALGGRLRRKTSVGAPRAGLNIGLHLCRSPGPA